VIIERIVGCGYCSIRAWIRRSVHTQNQSRLLDEYEVRQRRYAKFKAMGVKRYQKARVHCHDWSVDTGLCFDAVVQSRFI
jgi:hypothetical protein